MACKIEIEKTINKSIDKELPNREALFPESVAIGTRDKLNTLWSSAISKVTPVSDRFKVVINNLTDAVNKEYAAQVSAEKDFEENLDFFEEDTSKNKESSLSFAQETKAVTPYITPSVETVATEHNKILTEEEISPIETYSHKKYVVLSEKVGDQFTNWSKKSVKSKQGFHYPKQFYDNDRKVLYIKSNKNKRSLLYNVVDNETGEILKEKVRLYTKDSFEEKNKEVKASNEYEDTKEYYPNRTIAFSLYQNKPNRNTYIAQAKKYLYDGINKVNADSNIHGERVNINLGEVEKMLEAFPSAIWDYVSSSLVKGAPNSRVNASISIKNSIPIQLPKLGIIKSMEVELGVPLNGVTFKHYSRDEDFGKQFRNVKWGGDITISNKLTKDQIYEAIKYYAFESGKVKNVDDKKGKAGFIEYNGITEAELNDYLDKQRAEIDELKREKVDDNALDYHLENIENHERALRAVYKYIENFAGGMALAYKNMDAKFEANLKENLIKKFGDKFLGNGISHLDYFFSGNFNWMNVNFNLTPTSYGERERTMSLGDTTYKLKEDQAGLYTQPSEAYNRLAAVLHEPFHALHALTYGSEEEKAMRSAYDSLRNTTFGKELLNTLFGQGYNNKEVSEDTAYKEFTAFTFQLMVYPQQWREKTELLSNDIQEFFESIVSLGDREHTEITKRLTEISSDPREVIKSEAIKLNFLQNLYNTLIKALHNTIALSKNFFKLIEDVNYVTSTEVDSYFQEEDVENTIVTKLPEHIKQNKEDFLNKMEELRNSINALVSVDDQTLNPQGITDFFGKKEYEQAPPYLQKTSQKGRTSTIPSTASPKTVAVVKDFLKRIGVTVSGVNKVVVGGVPLDANGVAVMSQHLVQVVNGKEAQALPEEAMHFAVEILEQKNPGLFNKLMKEINSYQIYKDVLVEYGTDPLYTTPDGKPDIRKLKKEAIAKVLVNTIVKQDINENVDNINKAQSWWDIIIEKLKEIFLTSGFDAASMKILSGENIGTAKDIKTDSVYLQKSLQDQLTDNILTVHRKISKNPVKNPEGGEEDKYFIDGKEIPHRVSNLTKTWYDKLRADKALTDSEYQKALNTHRADKGTDGHKDLEYIHKMYFDKDGHRRAIPLDDSNYTSILNKYDRTLYDTLKDNYIARINTYPVGTRILSEITIYNGKDVAGTVDFLAIMPDAKVDILDWKFKVINTEFYEDIPWYNIASWNRQMGMYKSILQNSYNIKSTDFRQTMMIPIRAIYSGGNPKKNILPTLDNIEIGDVNIKNIKDDYLIPVGIESQKTGIRRLDNLLEKLNALHKKLSEKKVLPGERANKNEQLNALFRAIRHLQMKQNIEPLLHQAKTLNKQMERLLSKYATDFRGKDKSDFTPKQISDFVDEIHLAEEVLNSYQEFNNELRFMFEGKTLTEDEKALREELRDVVEDVREYKTSISEMYTDFTVEFVGGTNQAEKVVKGFTKWFGTTATIQLKALEDLYKKANRSVFLSTKDNLTEVKRLEELKDAYTAWASSKGLTKKDMFSIIKKEDKNELIDEFKPEFYKELNKRIQTKDYAWLKDNVDINAYRDHLKEKLDEELERIENKIYAGEEKLAEYNKQRDIQSAKDRYSIKDEDSIGWLLYSEISKFPNKDIWESDKWKELHRPENKPALDFYNYIRERNEYYASIGYINNPDARKFLPWVRKSFMENIMFDGKVALGEQFLRNISIDESNVGYGKIDPITGKPIDELPKYFTTEIQDESENLFKTMALYNEMAIKFNYMSEIEAQGRALIRLEKNKSALATSVFGRTEKDEYGELKINPNNVENSKLVEDMVKAIIYGQKYIESETFDQLLGKLGNFGENINKKVGFKFLPENLQNRSISANKALDTLNNVFQLKSLGLNPLSSISNLFGGKTQSWLNSGKYFTKTDFVSTEKWLIENRMGGADKQKMLAALDYFIPFVENYNRDAAKKMSLGKLDEQVVQDWLMVLMRSGDRAVQTTNFFAFLRHSIVQNGKVVNTREYLRSTPEYADMYAGTKEERDARASKFEEDVKKLNEDKGVIKLGTVVNGNFVLPGVDPKDESIIEFRRSVHAFTNDALGSASEENKRTINMTIYGNSMMIFKNWIPRLVDVRIGNLKYNAASDAYEWGRMRTFSKVLGDTVLKDIGTLTNTLSANDKGIEYMRELFNKKRETYKAETGKDLQMTESQFIDLVRQNVENQLYDLLVTLGLFALYLGLKAIPPDDDEDPRIKNSYKFLLKATDKLKDELAYFYDPTSLTSLVGSGIFPSIGLLNDYKKVISHSFTEIYALTVQDDELVESNQTVKYWMRTFPVAAQAASMLPLFYPDLAKDLGIKMQEKYGYK